MTNDDAAQIPGVETEIPTMEVPNVMTTGVGGMVEAAMASVTPMETTTIKTAAMELS